MAEHSNVGLLRRGYAFANGDMATITGLWSEDIVWHWPGAGALCGDHVGRDAVFAVLGRMAELSPSKGRGFESRRPCQSICSASCGAKPHVEVVLRPADKMDGSTYSLPQR